MKSAPVQNSLFLASLPRAKQRARLALCSLFSMMVGLIFIPLSFYAQTDTSKLVVGEKLSTQPNDTVIKPGSPEIEKMNSPYYYLTSEQKRKRQWFIGDVNVIGYGAWIIILDNIWFKDYPETSFNTFNDSMERLHMGKVVHGWAPHNAGRAVAVMRVWAGVEPKKAAWIGGISSTAYLTVIEILDAHSPKWGWSWSDMAANVLGSA